MKNILKYTVLPRCFPLLLALTLMVTAAVLPAVAAEPAYTLWTYVKTTDTLVAAFPDGDELLYTHYEFGHRLRYGGLHGLQYENGVSMNGTDYTIYSNGYGESILVLKNSDGGILVYVTEEGREILDGLFAEREPASVALHFNEGNLHKYQRLSPRLLRDLRDMREYTLEHEGESAVETLTDTLYGLRYAPRYELWEDAEGGFISAVHAYLFDLDGELYYLDVFDLPDSAFDMEGGLIPSESVTVTLYRLPDDMQENTYIDIYSASNVYDSVDLERYLNAYENIFTGDNDTPVGFVYFTIALLGIALPIAPIVLGLCLPHSQKQGYSKRWYLLTWMGGAWMLLGILLLVLMIVAL